MDVKSKQQLGFYRDESPGLPLGCLAFGGGTDVSSNMPMHLAAGEQGGAASQLEALACWDMIPVVST
eukprot:1157836-Pelagomonas_calceolata.AAC.4